MRRCRLSGIPRSPRFHRILSEWGGLVLVAGSVRQGGGALRITDWLPQALALPFVGPNISTHSGNATHSLIHQGGRLQVAWKGGGSEGSPGKTSWGSMYEVHGGSRRYIKDCTCTCTFLYRADRQRANHQPKHLFSMKVYIAPS